MSILDPIFRFRENFAFVVFKNHLIIKVREGRQSGRDTNLALRLKLSIRGVDLAVYY